MIEAKDLRGNDADELRRTVRKLEEDLFKHRLKKNTSQLENTMLIRGTRRDIARVNTVLAEKLRGEPVAAKAQGKDEAASGAGAEEKAAASAKAGKATKAAAKKAPAKAKTEKAQSGKAKET
ncbi:MAG TPA: 50S ribosomal protein L29 [Polyangia bacterium]